MLAVTYSRAQALASGVGALASEFAMAHRRFIPAITTNNIGIGRPKPTDGFWFLVPSLSSGHRPEPFTSH